MRGLLVGKVRPSPYTPGRFVVSGTVTFEKGGIDGLDVELQAGTDLELEDGFRFVESRVEFHDWLGGYVLVAASKVDDRGHLVPVLFTKLERLGELGARVRLVVAGDRRTGFAGAPAAGRESPQPSPPPSRSRASGQRSRAEERRGSASGGAVSSAEKAQQETNSKGSGRDA